MLRHSVDLAHQVRDGSKHFDEALAEVKDAEQVSKSRDAQLNELRTKASDVAALVSDGRLTLEAGMAELRQHQASVRQCLDAGRSSAARFANLGLHLTVIQTADRLTPSDLAMIGTERADADPLAELSDKEVEALIAAVEVIRNMKQARRGDQ